MRTHGACRYCLIGAPHICMLRGIMVLLYSYRSTSLFQISTVNSLVYDLKHGRGCQVREISRSVKCFYT